MGMSFPLRSTWRSCARVTTKSWWQVGPTWAASADLGSADLCVLGALPVPRVPAQAAEIMGERDRFIFRQVTNQEAVGRARSEEYFTRAICGPRLARQARARNSGLSLHSCDAKMGFLQAMRVCSGHLLGSPSQQAQRWEDPA